MRKYIDIINEAVSPTTGRKRRVSDAEFIQMARTELGAKAAKLSLPDMTAFADQMGVQIPTGIRHNRDLKIDAHHWNLSGGAHDPNVDQQVARDLGVEVTPADEVDPESDYATALRLAKAKEVNRLASAGKVYLMGRSPKNGAFFRVKGFEEYTAQLERMLARELEARGEGTMEEQYQTLIEKVELIAGNKNQFVKSILITGAPSSGKTFTVMQAVKAAGLKEGTDYVIKKGRITVPSMYRTLIEQVNGLTIFDDCDSVVEDKNGINMLKGALDTDPVREISYDVRGTVNTASLTSAEREEYVERLSRLLRLQPSTSEDVEFFREFLDRNNLLSKILKNKKKAKKRDDDDDDLDLDDEFDDEDAGEADLILNYIRSHMPNKIDYKGRIIFISNLDEGEWDSAILTRAMSQNMNFSSTEMLDFIDRIKHNIPTPNLDEEQKQEVMDFIRDLYTTGKLKRAVNFRLVQQAFDLRQTPSWKKILGQM